MTRWEPTAKGSIQLYYGYAMSLIEISKTHLSDGSKSLATQSIDDLIEILLELREKILNE